MKNEGGTGTVQGTETVENLIRKAGLDPMSFFEKYPIREVRLACIEHLEKLWCVDDQVANWAEKVIRSFQNQGGDSLAEKFISWYLFNASKNEMASRALKFVIEDVQFIGSHYKSKVIIGRLLSKKTDTIDLYYNFGITGILRDFLTSLLRELETVGQFGFGYDMDNWHCVERAIRVVIDVKDRHFICEIRRLIALYQGGNVGLRHDLPPHLACMHLALLKHVVEEVLAKANNSQ